MSKHAKVSARHRRILTQALNREDYLLAPESGIFEVCVDLGEHVKKGDTVGHIHHLERPDRAAGDHCRTEQRLSRHDARPMSHTAGRLRGRDCKAGESGRGAKRMTTAAPRESHDSSSNPFSFAATDESTVMASKDSSSRGVKPQALFLLVFMWVAYF